ncbi:MAG: carboxypeptidase-like regulatory domain-containing protein, partial [Acidobacteriota bacterium]|nr:carboxypeptidase-like regulatory domain-containing protein [Acidobacteriota bacterium]
MKQTRRSYRLLFLALLLGFAFHAFGQEATILGTVTDPSGSVIPNATVTITSIDTGQVYPGKTNDSGQYLMPALINGKYKIKVEASGFKASERNDIVLNVGDRARADFQMQVGDTSVTLNVEADAVKVQSDSSEVSDVITGQQVTQLATNGRSIYSLTTLLPGASGNQGDFQAPTAVSGDNNVSFNGMRKSSTLYLVDGGEDLDRGGSGNISILPSIDAVGEFRALTSNYSSEFGLASGATFTLVFKSGTKDFHAGAWEFARNDALDAGNYFTNAAGKTPPKLRSNTYGFNVGGPVFIPKLYNKDRNKTFFFYNMEWRKLIQGQSLNQTVPLTGEYGGIFPSSSVIHVPNANQLSAALIAKYAALGLSPGQAFPGNAIPSSLLDSNAQLLLKTGIFPSPNNG